MNGSPRMHVVMYHYVQDPERARFPRLRGMTVRAFREQVELLAGRYEMAGVESALAFLKGEYVPRRDLCLLTFDDGLREHGDTVPEILAPRGIQGVFFLITACLSEHVVAPVHQNHVLMATLPFEEYRRAFLQRRAEMTRRPPPETDGETLKRCYRWDPPEVAAFKYLLNFQTDENVRARILSDLLAQYVGDEAELAREFYVDWGGARRMRAEGMELGAHTHRHACMAEQEPQALESDLKQCLSEFRRELGVRPRVFSYPYGKETSFREENVGLLKTLGFVCAFTSERGDNAPGRDAFRIRRIDPKDVRD